MLDLHQRRRLLRRRAQRQRLAVAVILATATGASAAHAINQPAPRLDCDQRPAACERALVWQRHARRTQAQRIRELRRHLRRVHAPTVREAAMLAGRAFGVNPWALLRVGACETGGTFDPYAYNPSSGAQGWLQFLSSTWQHTPFAAWPRTDPYAQALAAAQIVRADGSFAQWQCGWAAR